MRIEVQYSVSQGPHPIEIAPAEIEQMRQSGELTATQPTPSGTKTLTITGTPQEVFSLAVALLNNAAPSLGARG